MIEYSTRQTAIQVRNYYWVSETTHLKYASTVRCTPGVQQVVFTGTDKPLAAVGELEWQHAAIV